MRNFNFQNFNLMEMNLISMTDFILKFVPDSETDDAKLLDRVLNYAQFLKTPLALWMFVPTDENENILKEPVLKHGWDVNGEPTIYTDTYKSELQKYNIAKVQVLFKDFTVEQSGDLLNIIHNEWLMPVMFKPKTGKWTDKWFPIDSWGNIEEMLSNYPEIELTETAIINLGL